MRVELNKRWPWMKFALPILVAGLVILNLEGVFRREIGESEEIIPETPFSRQAKVPDRIFRRSIDGKKLVALTFDDGPGAETTPRLLDILKEKSVPATFFELGYKMRNNPEISKRAEEEGHEVGSHTMWHQNLVRVSGAGITDDINEAKQVFRETLGREVGIMRLPYGNSNALVAGIAGVPLLYWSVDTRDWDVLNAEIVENNAIGAAFDGAIILMHDIYGSTVDAVPGIIDRLRQEGYEFVTITELATLRGVTLQNGETYFSFKP